MSAIAFAPRCPWRQGVFCRHRQDAVAGRAAVLHARDHFLAHIAALGETHAMKQVEIGLMGEHVVAANVGSAISNAQGDAVDVMVAGVSRGARPHDGALAERVGAWSSPAIRPPWPTATATSSGVAMLILLRSR